MKLTVTNACAPARKRTWGDIPHLTLIEGRHSRKFYLWNRELGQLNCLQPGLSSLTQQRGDEFTEADWRVLEPSEVITLSNEGSC